MTFVLSRSGFLCRYHGEEKKSIIGQVGTHNIITIASYSLEGDGARESAGSAGGLIKLHSARFN